MCIIFTIEIIFINLYNIYCLFIRDMYMDLSLITLVNQNRLKIFVVYSVQIKYVNNASNH